MKILNLGCGTKVSNSPDVVNIDWSIYLRIKKNPLARRMATVVLKGHRLERFRSIDENILIHDLSKGIPFPDNSVDVVYNSHLLEHLDRSVARQFVTEAFSKLKSDGVIRIVVPNLESLATAYLAHIEQCASADGSEEDHDNYIAPMLEQSVRREAYGSSQQRQPRRLIENLLLGDARKRGQTHQWMYDRINLKHLLESVGFVRAAQQRFDTSYVEGWATYGLDDDGHGGEYKPGSLYMEAVKP